MVFVTPAVSDVINITDVHVTYDHVTRRHSSTVQFEYSDNPLVTDIRPLAAFHKYSIACDFCYHSLSFSRDVTSIQHSKVRPSIYIAHFCIRRRPAVKPPQMRSRH